MFPTKNLYSDLFSVKPAIKVHKTSQSINNEFKHFWFNLTFYTSMYTYCSLLTLIILHCMKDSCSLHTRDASGVRFNISSRENVSKEINKGVRELIILLENFLNEVVYDSPR